MSARCGGQRFSDSYGQRFCGGCNWGRLLGTEEDELLGNSWGRRRMNSISKILPGGAEVEESAASSRSGIELSLRILGAFTVK